MKEEKPVVVEDLDITQQIDPDLSSAEGVIPGTEGETSGAELDLEIEDLDLTGSIPAETIEDDLLKAVAESAAGVWKVSPRSKEPETDEWDDIQIEMSETLLVDAEEPPVPKADEPVNAEEPPVPESDEPAGDADEETAAPPPAEPPEEDDGEEEDDGDDGEYDDDEEEEPSKKGRGKWIALIAVLVVILAAGAFGVYRVMENKKMTAYYEDRYLPGTTIDGVDCAGMTVEEAVALFEGEAEEYTLTLTDVYGNTDTISGTDFDLTAEGFAEEFQAILDSQDPSTWRKAAENPTEATVTSAWEYDEDLLIQCVEESVLFAEMIESSDACVYYDETSGLYVLQEAVIGNVVDLTVVETLVEEAVAAMDTELSLVDAGLYAEVLESTEAMASAVTELNLYASCTVSLDFGSAGTETLARETLLSCLSYDEDYNVTFDQTPISSWVSSLASTYNTVGTSRSFKSTSSGTVTVSGGTYGWTMDQSSTVSAIVSSLQSGVSFSGEATWSSEGDSHSSADWGSTYLEVDLTNQSVYLYKSGSLVWSSSCVSGDPSEGNMTVRGVYYIYNKEKNRTLRGTLQSDGSYSYESFVYYWMPFYGGYGLHDATWRSSFGGTIYAYNGSHGCVNLPLSKASTLYDLVYVGLPVIVFGGYDNYSVPTTAAATTTAEETTTTAEATETAAETTTAEATETAAEETTEAVEETTAADATESGE